jgi:hypothetical protein
MKFSCRVAKQEYWELRRIFPPRGSQFLWLKKSGTPKGPKLPNAQENSWATLSAAVINTGNYPPGWEMGKGTRRGADNLSPQHTTCLETWRRVSQAWYWAVAPYTTPQILQYLMLFHGRNCYANAPQCDFISTLPLLLVLNLCWLVFVSEMEAILLEIGASHWYCLYRSHTCLHLYLSSCFIDPQLSGHHRKKKYFPLLFFLSFIFIFHLTDVMFINVISWNHYYPRHKHFCRTFLCLNHRRR